MGQVSHSAESSPSGQSSEPHPDALLVALILAPHTFSRNKFFSLFEKGERRRIRRRAQAVRSIISDLSEPWPLPDRSQQAKAVIVVQEISSEGLYLVYRVEEFNYERTARLDSLEAATLKYALSRIGLMDCAPNDRARIEAALSELRPPDAAAV